MKTEDLGLVLSLDQVIKKTEGQLEYARELKKRARSTKSKVRIYMSIEYLRALLYHLNRLKIYERSDKKDI